MPSYSAPWLSLSVLIGTQLASLVGNAQKTNATCYSGYSWMNNERGQSPCLVASYLLSPCSTSSEGVVIPALNDSHSLYNFAETSLADTPCVCSTVTFSMLYACATCQGAELAIIPWYIASENCTQRYLLSYPEIIPRDTSIPYWAYDPNVGITGRLDIATAKQESSEGEYENPDATLSGAYSGGPTSYNPYGNSPYDPGAYEGEQLAGDGQGTSVGVIVGAVVGGSVGVIAAVSIAILLVRRSRHRRTRGTPVGTDVGGPAVPSKGDSFAAGSTAKLYDPDDPTTYPGVMPSLAPTSDKTAPQLSYTGRPEV